MSDIKISEMNSAQAIGDSDLIELSQENSGSYSTAKTSISALKNKIAGTELTGTLSLGQTSIQFEHACITTSATYQFFTNIFGVNPTNVTVTNGNPNGTLVLTFDAQQSDMSVKVRVS